ncbi:hypothetical protein AS026_30520 [Rhizobium altiplani]|uniref:Uncharacterized protein n=1 Tax=Rhizobium altiplani TaxID=1864509 RepID=A0A120FQE0_9HYPH|nr:hypothetical protein [Rhizobium altiplani]KWV58401.1 hypothetical protein AS026_30520 [Rhizobium altiplani]
MLEPPLGVATIATCYGGPKAGLQALAGTRRAETPVEDGNAVAASASLAGPKAAAGREGRRVEADPQVQEGYTKATGASASGKISRPAPTVPGIRSGYAVSRALPATVRCRRYRRCTAC